QKRHDIKPDGQERLCAVCTVKRFVQREVLQDEFGLQGGFPSTSEVAAVRFKERILDKLADARVSEALDHFLRHAEQVPIPRTVAENAVPYLEKKAESQFGRDLLKLDGEYLFTDTWTPKHLREVNPNLTEEEAEAKAQEGRRLLGRLYEAVGTQPKKYYAILFMDGDHMGRWLSGTHRGLAQFGDILHPEVRQALKNDPQWSGILGQKRLMTPAVHAAISGALANFSLKLVRWVIEERHAGRVVYAGGDDVLALLPVDDVLSAVRELRALFSGEVKVNGPQNADLRHVSWEVSFGDQTCTGYIVFGGELLLTMGPTATASIGVAIAHHLHPLDLALQAARRAEKAAKETYGRNALAVEVLKRSGEAISVGTQFYSQDKRTDAVAILQEFCAKLQAEKISAKFPYVLSAEVRTLEALPREAQEAELRRLLKRHAGEKLGREEKEEQAREWAKKLLRLVAILEASHGNEDKAPPKPPGLERLSNWLLVCSFIVRGSEP
ncbi:MAG: type III-B CRISPR-associated protein Cas10/Cmr2, partial [Gemmataceae bacterium]